MRPRSRTDDLADFGGAPKAALVAEDFFMSGVRGQETVRLDLQFPGVACTATEDMARQEYALSADIKYQIQRFGVGHPGQFGNQDFDAMDLTSAMALVEESSQRWLALPAAIRSRYGSWAAIEAAAKTGELGQFLQASGVPAASGGAPEAAASDSAPGTPRKGG